VPLAGYVPDHLPRLKKGDFVEFRNYGSVMYSLDGFASGEDANAIVRVLRRKADSSYEGCVEALPKIGRYPGGTMKTLYPKHVRDYGFAFTPMYEPTKGTKLRKFPDEE
jgi:hypothetical protein